MKRFRFTLYIAGESLRSTRATENLQRLADEHLGGEVDISVVDVLTDPASAETARILTTPTLVKEAPEPARRVTGDLGNIVLVAAALGLRPVRPVDGEKAS